MVTSDEKNPSSLQFSTLSSGLEQTLTETNAQSIDVLIHTVTQDYSDLTADIKALGGTIKYTYNYATGLAANVPVNQIPTLKCHPAVKTIRKDAIRTPSALSSNPIETFPDQDRLIEPPYAQPTP